MTDNGTTVYYLKTTTSDTDPQRVMIRLSMELKKEIMGGF